jgi:hypothetical protein
MGTVREPLLQLRAGVRGHLNCVDFHHWHVARLPRRYKRPNKAGSRLVHG